MQFAGSIYDVALYDRAWTDDDFLRIYPPIPTPPPLPPSTPTPLPIRTLPTKPTRPATLPPLTWVNYVSLHVHTATIIFSLF